MKKVFFLLVSSFLMLHSLSAAILIVDEGSGKEAEYFKKLFIEAGYTGISKTSSKEHDFQSAVRKCDTLIWCMEDRALDSKDIWVMERFIRFGGKNLLLCGSMICNSEREREFVRNTFGKVIYAESLPETFTVQLPSPHPCSFGQEKRFQVTGIKQAFYAAFNDENSWLFRIFDSHSNDDLLKNDILSSVSIAKTGENNKALMLFSPSSVKTSESIKPFILNLIHILCDTPDKLLSQISAAEGKMDRNYDDAYGRAVFQLVMIISDSVKKHSFKALDLYINRKKDLPADAVKFIDNYLTGVFFITDNAGDPAVRARFLLSGIGDEE